MCGPGGSLGRAIASARALRAARCACAARRGPAGARRSGAPPRPRRRGPRRRARRGATAAQPAAARAVVPHARARSRRPASRRAHGRAAPPASSSPPSGARGVHDQHVRLEPRRRGARPRTRARPARPRTPPPRAAAASPPAPAPARAIDERLAAPGRGAGELRRDRHPVAEHERGEVLARDAAVPARGPVRLEAARLDPVHHRRERDPEEPGGLEGRVEARHRRKCSADRPARSGTPGARASMVRKSACLRPPTSWAPSR